MYEVAVPSHARAGTLAAKTLPMLAAGGVPRDRVTVFVPVAQVDEYRGVLDSGTYGQIEGLDYVPGPTPERIEDGPANLGIARNEIARRYPAGTDLLQIDDDMRGLIRRTGEQTVADVADVDALITAGFDLARRYDCWLWGVYPAPNPYFMKDRVRVDHLYIGGGMFGVRVRHDPCELVVLDDKEDFERSIRFYERDGAVLRIEWVSWRTEGYAGAGGLQTVRTDPNIERSARWLAARYPGLCRLNMAKKSGKAEVRLRISSGGAR